MLTLCNTNVVETHTKNIFIKMEFVQQKLFTSEYLEMFRNNIKKDSIYKIVIKVNQLISLFNFSFNFFVNITDTSTATGII